jgi:hypothetical protein
MVFINTFDLGNHIGKKLDNRVKGSLIRLHQQERHRHHDIFLATSSPEGFG